MREFSSVELLRDIKTVTMAADRHPVTITQHRKPRYVLMTHEEYQKLVKTHPDPRRVFGPGETPDELVELILPELDRLIENGAASDA